MLKQIRQLEDRQQILKREVKRLSKEAMIEKAEFEKQKMRWEREKISLQGAVREVGVRTDELQEKMRYQEILMEEYKQEGKKKK